MNTITLLGRTTAAIELKQTQAGKSVATFSLAVKRPFTKDTTDFFNVTVWDKQAEVMSQYVNKGDQICIRGYLQTRSWEDNNGNKRSAVDVVAQEFDFCGKNSAEQTETDSPNTYIPDAYKTQQNANLEPTDDLPF